MIFRSETHAGIPSCRFCRGESGEVDYKDLGRISRHIARSGRILPARMTGLCSVHQQALGLAVKRARFMALLPRV